MAVVATGFFDGVHLGHQKVLKTLVSSARMKGEEAIVVTFDAHPRAVLQQDAPALRLLSSSEEKLELLHRSGVDRVEVIPFTKEFAALSAREYIETILIGRFGASSLVLGYDNSLGSDLMDPLEISALSRSLGLEVVIVPAYYLDETTVVSSTKIRSALREGDVSMAARMLGYDYSLSGLVVSGKQLGRTIGFPTANMALSYPLKLIPARGVYLSRVKTLGREFYGMTNIGDVIETNIFDFNESIYGLDLTISLCQRMRDMQKMSSLEELKTRLDEDRSRANRLICQMKG